MAEERSTIAERVVRIFVELLGAEEVKKGLAGVDAQATKMAVAMQNDTKLMAQLSGAFKEVGLNAKKFNIDSLPGLRFLEQYAVAAKSAWAEGKDLSLTFYAQSEAGKAVAESTGLISPAMVDAAKKTGSLRDAFWSLNSMARALLRVFVAFQIIKQVLGIFTQMADASAKLQAELWRLRATVEGVSSQIEGGAGSWDSWLGRLERLRALLPLVSMTELAEGLRTITAIMGPLGLTADEIERVTGLVGKMAKVVGEEFPAYVDLLTTALTGTGRSVSNLQIDLRDGSKGLMDYAGSLGYVWDELNAQQRQWVRLGYFVQEATTRTSTLTGAEKEEWQQLEELRKKREDILAQSPELITAQIKWAELLLKAAEAAERLVGALDKMAKKSPEWGDAFEKIAFALGMVWKALTGGTLATYEWAKTLEWLATIKEPWQEMAEGTGDFNKAVKEGIEASKDQGKAAEELGDKMRSGLEQAEDALLSYQNAVNQAGINLSRRLADIARNLEEKLQDLEDEFERRREELIRDFTERQTEIREEAAEKEEELRKDLDERLRRMEEDYLLEMKQLREDYLLDLEEAARSRDAISMRRIQQRYILEKRQRGEEYELNRRRTIEDYNRQLEDLKKAREDQKEELKRSLEEQLQDLEDNYLRQQEEARTNAQRQRDDAIKNYNEQRDDLETNFQERLASIIISLTREEKKFKEVYGRLQEFFSTWYKGNLATFKKWLEDTLKAIEDAEPSPHAPDHGPVPFAGGGFGVARHPTTLLVGERGPEAFAAWPAGTRLPRESVDVRLSIDGTQSGLWSGEFETQVLRIFRGILEEAL